MRNAPVAPILPRWPGLLLALLCAGCGEESVSTPAPTAPEPESPPPGPLPPPAPRTRLELALEGKPEGVLFLDLDGDGRDELLAVTKNPAALFSFDAPPTGWSLSPSARRTPLPGYPLGPVALPAGADGAQRVGIASRETHELLVIEPLAEKGHEIVARLKIAARPRALASGAGGLVAVDAQGILWIWDGGEEERRIPTGEDQACCVAQLADGRYAVGYQGSRSLRLFASSGEESTHIALPGIPRAIDELEIGAERSLAVAGGDDALWLFDPLADGSYAQRAELRIGAIPLRLLAGEEGAPSIVLEYDGNSIRALSVAELSEGTPGRAEYAGQTPWDVARGDWNGDGLPDIALANRDAQRVSVLFGAQGGGLRRALRVPTGRAPHSLIAGDLDGDGLPDVAVINSLTSTLRILHNAGGLLQPGAEIPAGPGADNLAVVDLNGDGRLDVAWTVRDANGARLVASFSLAGGERGAPHALSEPAQLRSAADLVFCDLDGDGRREAWIADRDAGLLVGLRVAEDGREATWLAQLELPGGPRALASIEVGGAQRLAVAAGDGVGQSGVGVFALEGGELVMEHSLATGLEPLALEAADVTGDGLLDLALLGRRGAGAATGELRVLAQEESGAFQPIARLVTGQRPFAVRAADLTGDGRADLTVSAQNSHHVNLWLSRASGIERASDLGAGIGCLALCFSDLDGDGTPELLVANAFSDDISVIRFE